MQTLGLSSSVERYVRYGRYTSARLARENFTNLANTALELTQELLEKGRGWEDQSFNLQDLIADRDAVDDLIDEVTQSIRRGLGSRSTDATKTTPYTSIFHAGITFYTASPLSQQFERHQILIQRLEKFLAEDDPVRVDAIPKLKQGLETFDAAFKAVRTHRVAVSVTAAELNEMKNTFNRGMERIYGLLVAEGSVGRRRAERFFPRIRSTSAPTSSEEADNISTPEV